MFFYTEVIEFRNTAFLLIVVIILKMHYVE